jgi:predicted MFS family arabinose efflux permease
MWLVGSIFYAYQYILRVAPSILIDDIMARFQIDANIFGQFSGAYYFGYSLIHLPLGLALDRFGARKILPIFILLTALGMAPLVLTDFWVYPWLGRAMVGIGSSAAILGLFKIIRMGFSQNNFTTMLSFSVTIGLMGALYGGAPLYALHQQFGFDKVVFGLMAIACLLALITFAVIPDSKAEALHKGKTWKHVLSILQNKYVLLVCVFAGFMVGPLEGFADVWGSVFLKKIYGLDDAHAASIPSVTFLGMCFGGPLLSLLAKKIKNDLVVILLAALSMLLAFIALLSGSVPEMWLSSLFFAVGVMCAYQIIAIAHAATKVQDEQVGLASAVANMIIMIFGYVFHSLIGKTVQYFSNSAAGNATEIGGAISTEGILYGVSVIPVMMAFALLGFTFLALRYRAANK